MPEGMVSYIATKIQLYARESPILVLSIRIMKRSQLHTEHIFIIWSCIRIRGEASCELN